MSEGVGAPLGGIMEDPATGSANGALIALLTHLEPGPDTRLALAVRQGATELDMVIQIGALKSGDLRVVERDIEAVTGPCRACGALSKVIIEAALLNVMFDLPSRKDVNKCVITRETIEKHIDPTLVDARLQMVHVSLHQGDRARAHAILADLRREAEEDAQHVGRLP